MFNRRSLFLVLLLSILNGCVRPRRRRAHGYRRRRSIGLRPRHRRHANRRRRRRRRRIHRNVAWRSVRGRRVVVVPVGLVVGWELSMPDRVVVVQEVKTVPVDGGSQEYLVVVAPNGEREEIPIIREDTAENSKDLEGSELPVEDATEDTSEN